MDLPDRPLAPLDDRKLDLINRTLDACDTEHDMVLMSQVANAAHAAGEADDAAGQEALTLIARLLLVHIDGLDHDRPASAAALLPQNVPDEKELEAMRLLVERINKPIVRARIADLIWQKARDHRMGCVAVKAYLEAGAPFEDPDKWTGCTKRYERALQLAASLGKSQPLFAETHAHIEAALDRHGPTDTSFLSRELMDLVIELKRGDPEACAKYAGMAGDIARRLEEVGELFRAREYWAAKEKWDYARNDQASARASKTALAESLVKEADLELEKPDPSYFRAAFFMRQAVGILDKLQPESRPRIAELRQRVAELAEKEAARPRPAHEPFDLSDVAQWARDQVKGKPLPDALLTLAAITNLPVRSQLEAQVRESSKGFLHMIFPSMRMGERGTLVAASAGIDPADPDSGPLLAQMVTDAQVAYGVSGTGINVARMTILEDHDVREHHFAQLAYASDFVPPGREGAFAKGLNAGMQGDFFTALHLLLPQLENALRRILQKTGENTVIINRKGWDEERDLDALLRLPKAAEVFGENLCFSLRALLLHRFGPNLRNLLSHGLLDPRMASTTQAVYAWWLVLRLCCSPLLRAQARAEEPAEQSEGNAETPPRSDERAD
jgi:hypothetical protein